MKKFLTLVLTLALVCSLSVTAFAAGTVTFDGNAQEFIFEPGSDHSPTDLFSDFKGVMPGDSITQQVTIKNATSNEVKVNLYMRALGAQSGSEALLSQLGLKVAAAEDNTMAYMFDAAASETAQLTDWVFLGVVYSGGEVVLDVTLEVPITLGNEFQDAIGYLDWQFKVEELPVEPGDPKPPQTGDDSNMVLYASLMAVSVVVLILVVLLGKRRKNAEEK